MPDWLLLAALALVVVLALQGWASTRTNSRPWGIVALVSLLALVAYTVDTFAGEGDNA